MSEDKYKIGVSFDGDNNFSLAELNEIKKEVLSITMNTPNFLALVEKVMNQKSITKEKAFRAVQYCLINRNN